MEVYWPATIAALLVPSRQIAAELTGALLPDALESIAGRTSGQVAGSTRSRLARPGIS